MASLNWIGKDAVVNHDREVPFKLLHKVPSASVGKESKNLVIHGDNLEALKALMPFYKGKVKCIYIDPPYNTGNEGWVYNDKVNSPKIQEWIKKVVGREGEDLTRHDKWLCMMYPRLRLLRDLLTENGVIFISIDDNEHCNLRSLMDEIFGIGNFVVSFPRRTKSAGKTTDAVSANNDYVLVFAKNKKSVVFASLAIDDKAYKYKDEFFKERGSFALSQTLDYDSLSYSKSLDYELTLDGKRYYPGGRKDKFLSRKAGNHRSSDWAWRWSKELVNFGHKNGFLVVKKGKNGEPRIYTKTYYKVVIEKVNGSYQIIPIGRTKKLSTLDLTDSQYSNDVAKKDLRGIFGASAEFAYPKPISLIQYLIRAVSNTRNSIILDSFSGSGTTGHAVLDLNKKDGGNRKFIMVEMEDRVAKNITAERIKRAIKKYGYEDGFEFCELAKPLFNEKGQINERCSYTELATYIYFTETQTNAEKKNIKSPLVGVSGGTAYYLLYEGKGKNDLTRAALTKLKIKQPAVVYADRCLIDEDELREKGVVFKQIPYEIKVY
ncbi:MAG: site-specific DNA-methyltransferase [Candidatus Liptonbacteria bacterium]|nr:site-specific DNA-methyltransferase [Candidatus Liptonbacteria bacterium]